MKLNFNTLGIDIGSTTVKIAILDRDGNIIFSDYQRHFANIQETLSDIIKKAYDEGKVTDEDLDKRCQAIMGVVDRIKPDKNAVFDREAHHQFSKEVALNSMVLLKNNDNILPLDKAKSICFIGEFAQKPRYQGGGSSHINSWQVTPITTIHPEIPYAKGFSINSSAFLLDATPHMAIYF